MLRAVACSTTYLHFVELPTKDVIKYSNIKLRSGIYLQKSAAFQEFCCPAQDILYVKTASLIMLVCSAYNSKRLLYLLKMNKTLEVGTLQVSYTEHPHTALYCERLTFSLRSHKILQIVDKKVHKLVNTNLSYYVRRCTDHKRPAVAGPWASPGHSSVIAIALQFTQVHRFELYISNTNNKT